MCIRDSWKIVLNSIVELTMNNKININLKFIDPPILPMDNIDPNETITTIKDYISATKIDLDVEKLTFFCGGKHLYDPNKSFDYYGIEDGDSILIMNVDPAKFALPAITKERTEDRKKPTPDKHREDTGQTYDYAKAANLLAGAFSKSLVPQVEVPKSDLEYFCNRGYLDEEIREAYNQCSDHVGRKEMMV
eukprot:TRINITY_DN15578_c0_g1_i6.p1 TRINITY_DN15578_c0_g1~~TRINITY_DN15578_c0_g1_i6.p1  ORF type:complete len:206 (-),score=45.66 TRINITY_DN15578_c0_g1_i6:287-859(-)